MVGMKEGGNERLDQLVKIIDEIRMHGEERDVKKLDLDQCK